jgi:peptidoglycan/LPS O-acetylase OafA/YrhL
MQIVSIQVLRALAAAVVAFGHGQHFIGIPMEKQGQVFPWSHALPWASGVDLFFVISGFTMVYSSERLFGQAGGARTFAWRRVTRIAPLYWALTSYILIVDALRHKPGHDPISVLMSFLFIPWDTAGTGVPRPVFELGWTLNYEMFFYAVFALTIGFARETAAKITIGVLAALTLIGLVLQPVQAQAFVWTQPIILEFAFGVMLALAARRGLVLPLAARVALIAGGAAALYYDLLHSNMQPHAWLTPNDLWRVLGWGVPAAMIFAGVVLAPRAAADGAPGLLTRWGARLGDASYALYLCHPIVMSAFSALWFALKLNQTLNPWVGVVASLCLSVAASLIIYRWFELPMTRALQSAKQPRIKVRPAE